jgi:RNA polymerase sigma-70 factor (ECF subfamily)
MSTDEEIYRKHADDLVRFATGLVGPFDAPDVVTDACLRSFAARSWPKVANHRAYLYRAVLNEARSRHRSDMRRRARELRAAGPDSVPPAYVDVDVLDAVARLSLRQRAAVTLTYWEDLKSDEVALRLGISEGSVKRHLARARGRLKEILDG